jgi:hypothetical protein
MKTMKKLTVFALTAALAALLTIVPTPPPASAGVGVCDAQYGRLCWGLMEWWQFDHQADAQFGQFQHTPLYEANSNDVSIALAKNGSGIDFDGSNDVLYGYRWGTLPAYFTAAFWVNPDVVNATQTLVSNVSENYSTLTLGNYGGILLRIESDGKPSIIVYKDEAQQLYTQAKHTTALSAGTWYLLVYKVSPYGPYGNSQGCISINAGAFTCSSLTYNVKPATGDLMLGGRMGGAERYNGKMDSFGLWARAWDEDDLASYYKAGTGRVFPFRYAD